MLIDSSSTYKFMDAKMVSRLSLPLCHQEQLKVTVANGKNLMTRRTCRKMNWEAQGVSFVTDFMVLSVKGVTLS